MQLNGLFVKLYSRLRWETDATVRRRALVEPFVLPGLRLVRPVAPPKPLPPELPPLPPLAPVVAGAATLAGLLLLPANRANEPGNAAEWQFIEQQKQGFKDRDRLTYLEREREHRALSAQEQAEYVGLLAKVKGVRETGDELPPELAQLDLEATLDHAEYRDYSVPRSNGIGGAHNKTEFGKYKAEYKEFSRVTSESVPGVEHVSYQIYAIDRAGKMTGQLKAKIYSKSIYDPALWTRQKLKESLEQAMHDAYITSGKELPLPREWTGRTKEGYVIRAFYNSDQKRITTFFFEPKK